MVMSVIGYLAIFLYTHYGLSVYDVSTHIRINDRSPSEAEFWGDYLA